MFVVHESFVQLDAMNPLLFPKKFEQVSKLPIGMWTPFYSECTGALTYLVFPTIIGRSQTIPGTNTLQ